MINLPVFRDRVTVLNAENMNKLTTGITANENNISANMANITENIANISSNDYDIINLSTLVKTNTDNISSNDVNIDNLSSLQDDYLLLDGTRAMIGNLDVGTHLIKAQEIKRYADDDYFAIRGGTSNAAALTVNGKNEGVLPGTILGMVPNAAKSALVTAFVIEGVTDTPKLKTYFGFQTNTISERSAGSGVTIDGVLCKDNEIKRDVDDGYMVMRGGASNAAAITVNGKNESLLPGCIIGMVPNAAKSALVTAFVIEGVTDTPKLKTYFGFQTNTISERSAGSGVTIDGCLIKDGIATSARRDLSFHIKNLSSTEYLLGTGTVNTMYPFNETVTLTNYVITYDANSNSQIDVELADINGSWHSNSLTQLAAGGYQDNKSFTARIVGISNKLQIKLDNVSNINYMNFVLNYK